MSAEYNHLPMGRLFLACAKVLDSLLKPVHYCTLTERAMEELGEDQSLFDMSRLVEDVREKMLLAGRYGTIYSGYPDYLAAKRTWFWGVTDNLSLFQHEEKVFIPGNAGSGVRGGTEAMIRFPHMLTKHTGPNDRARIEGCVRGLVIESHVRDWIKQRWPDLYADPENIRQWEKPCDHDFKLKIGSRCWKVDIAGPLRDRSFSKSSQKPATDLHLLCAVSGSGVEMAAIVKGADFKKDIIPENIRSPLRFVVWLNSLQAGIDYGHICKVANTG